MTTPTYPHLDVTKFSSPVLPVCAVFSTLAIIAVILRIRIRIIKRKKLQFNDYTLFIALFFSICLAAICSMGDLWAYGGYHMSEINPVYRSRVFILFVAGQPVWAAANTALKFSILHLYLTIFPSQAFHRICYAMIGVSCAYFLSVLLETFVLCRPVRYNWDKTIDGTCDKNSLNAYIISGSTNLLLDVIVIALPMPILWKLRVPQAERIGLIAISGLGAFICVISLLRVILISRLDLADFTYAVNTIGVWSILEPTLGIVNATLPILRPMFKDVSKSRAVCWVLSTLKGLVSKMSSRNPAPSAKYTASLAKPVNEHDKFPQTVNTMDKLYPLDSVPFVRSQCHGDTEV